MKSHTGKLHFIGVITVLLFILSGCASQLSDTRTNRSDIPSDSAVHKANGERTETIESKSLTLKTATQPPAGTAMVDNGVAALEESAERDPAVEDQDNGSSASADKPVQKILDEALTYCEVSQEFWQKGELDNALEALDQAYALILDVDTSDQPKLIQQKEDLRFLISKRILEIYASRNIVVTGNHNAIPIVINRHVQSEIDSFTTGSERDFFIASYRRSGRYRPKIRAALREAGLPEELSWLPLIESGFKVNALSRARALGLWQFIPSTGYKFGLTRDKYIDERLDPDKATEAAIAYLKELHQIFGDWTTVLAAYNCGEGRVLRVIREQNVNYLDNFWDLYERLPYETARYVPRFLATLYIIENLDRYGLNNIDVDTPSEYEEIEIAKQVHLKHVALTVGSSEEQLTNLNPELRYKIIPPDNYTLKVPNGTAQILVSKIDSLPESKPPTRTVVYHRVRRGETLSTIARKYRIRVSSIMRANNLRRSNYIVAGRLLKIPMPGYRYQASLTSKPVVESATSHRVTRGDNLWNIAKKYGTTTTKIKEINNIRSSDLYIGQVLKLPGSADAGSDNQNSDAAFKVYQVKPGDSPFAIAQQHNMNLNRFLNINRLSNGSKIYPGQRLYIE